MLSELLVFLAGNLVVRLAFLVVWLLTMLVARINQLADGSSRILSMSIGYGSVVVVSVAAILCVKVMAGDRSLSLSQWVLVELAGLNGLAAMLVVFYIPIMALRPYVKRDLSK